MECDITFELADLMLKANGDLPFRLEAQANALTEIECTNRQIGKWVDSFEVPFLVETLTASEAHFMEDFPQSHVSIKRRQAFASAIQSHCEACPHCHLKVSYDLEWASVITKFVRESGNAICAGKR